MSFPCEVKLDTTKTVSNSTLNTGWRMGMITPLSINLGSIILYHGWLTGTPSSWMMTIAYINHVPLYPSCCTPIYPILMPYKLQLAIGMMFQSYGIAATTPVIIYQASWRVLMAKRLKAHPNRTTFFMELVESSQGVICPRMCFFFLNKVSTPGPCITLGDDEIILCPPWPWAACAADSTKGFATETCRRSVVRMVILMVNCLQTIW